VFSSQSAGSERASCMRLLFCRMSYCALASALVRFGLIYTLVRILALLDFLSDFANRMASCARSLTRTTVNQQFAWFVQILASNSLARNDFDRKS
jgi:hypothetical protein